MVRRVARGAASGGRRRFAARGPAPWARLFVAAHVLVVAAPLSVIAVWAFAPSWPWPDFVPSGVTLRGVQLVVSGGQGAGLDCIAFSVALALASAAVATFAATAAARAICLHEWRGKRLFEFAALLPFLIPSTVFAMGVQVAFIRAGLAHTVAGVVLAHAIVALPYAIAIMCDVTRGAGAQLEEAARVCGAGRLRTLVYVTLPGLAPGLVSAMSMGYILSFSQYFLTLLIGGGKVKTFALVLFPYLGGADRTVAGAYGLAFMAISFTVFLLFAFLLRKVRSVQDAGLYDD